MPGHFLLTDDDLLQRYLAKSEKLREHENTNYNLSLLVNKMKIVQKWRQQSLMTRVQHSVRKSQNQNRRENAIIGIKVSLIKTLSFFLMYEILQGLPELLCKLFLAAKLSSILIFQHYFLIIKKKKPRCKTLYPW